MGIEISKLRKGDEFGERLCHKFISDNFYGGVNGYVEGNDVEGQYSGIDCEFEYKGFHYICDEKSAIRYVNRPLGTFCFELSFIDRGRMLHDGWFLDNGKKSNSYILLYIDRGKKNFITDIGDILSAEIILVKKDRIVNYLKGIGWSIRKLRIKNDRIRNGKGFEDMGNIRKYGVKFSYSDGLAEKPINILISREKLREISEYSKKINVNKA